MTSFDDERPKRFRAGSLVRESVNNRQRLRSKTVSFLRTKPAYVSGVNPADERYHTGFFLANLIIRLWDEFRQASMHGNRFPLLRAGLVPSFRQFKHMSTGLKINVAICFSVFSFVLYILPVSLLVKASLASGLVLLATVPVLSQFFFYGMPVLAWVFLFFSAPKIPQGLRPPISVKVLPFMENVLYGDNLSDILAASHNTFLDLFAWFPYGIVHFALPFVVAALIWLFGPPTALRSYGWAFGYMNLTGVIIQQVFPAAPPWYKNLYGLDAANYSMAGSPGGLGRIDTLFGFDMYTTTFSTSPVIFGAFPSLHSGCATMSALWLTYLFPKYRSAFFGYVCWLWWSTMYLTHHYFFDLTAGTVLSMSFFYIVKMNSLPIKNDHCWCRFNYTEVEHYFYSDPLKEDSYGEASFSIEEPTIQTV